MTNNTLFSLDFFNSYFLLTLISLLFAYIISVTSYYFIHKKVKFFNFRFSTRNYYVMTIPFIIPAFLFFIFEGTFIYVFLFLFLAVAGVVGEIMFSFLWKEYFRRPFWKYSVSTIINKFSSWLNFLPWGFGGFLFLYTERFYVNYIGNGIDVVVLRENIFFVITQVILIFFIFLLFFRIVIKELVLRHFKRGRIKNKKIRVGIKYVYFIAPFLLIGLILPINYLDYFCLFLLFGVTAFFAEYGFGKMSKLIIGKKLWKYDYLTVDDRHTTPLNIIPFGFGGYYFLFLFLVVSFVLEKFFL